MAKQRFVRLPSLTEKQQANFLRQIKKGTPDQCWPWTGNRNKGGYGTFGVQYRTYICTRMVYLLASGVDPGDQRVCHSCDNPVCCNPAHLELGDQTFNMSGACLRGRIARGERVGPSKLVPEQVLEIRRRFANGESRLRMAKEYSVSYPTIFYITKRKAWTHL